MKIEFKNFRSLLLGLVLIGIAARAFGDRRIEWRENDRRLLVELKGEVTFAENDAEVGSISDGGRFVLEQDDGTTDRQVEIRPTADGTLRYRFTIDGKRADWEGSGKAWLARILPEMIRESAMGAKERVRRIRERSGPEGVLKEIGLIRSGGAKRAYFQELFDSGELARPVMKQAAQGMARIHSDGDKAAILIHSSSLYLSEPELLEDYFGAVGTIRSDGDRRRVLESALKQADGKEQTLALIAGSAKTISSDGDKGSVLRAAVAHLQNTEAAILAWLAAANTIRSDGDRRRALAEFFRASTLSPKAWEQALKSVARISSDGDKAAVLSEIVRALGQEESVQIGWVETASTIRTDGDRRRVLAEFLKREENSSGATAAALKSARKISSDGDKAALLSGSAKRLPNEELVWNAYLEAAGSIHSDGDRERALMAMLERSDLSESTLAVMRKSAARRGEGERSRVVRRLAELERTRN